MSALCESSTSLKTLRAPKCYNNVPGWNELCKEAHAEAREAFLWRMNGSKRQSHFFHMMCKARAVFKSILRKCSKNKLTHMSDSMAKK